MRYIIAGGRDFNNEEVMKKVLSNYSDITEVVCGCAKGADTLGCKWAQNNSIKLTLFPAAWEKYGASADYLRNNEMASYADKLITFWDGKSHGTKHMIGLFKNLNKPYYVYNYQGFLCD